MTCKTFICTSFRGGRSKRNGDDILHTKGHRVLAKFDCGSSKVRVAMPRKQNAAILTVFLSQEKMLQYRQSSLPKEKSGSQSYALLFFESFLSPSTNCLDNTFLVVPQRTFRTFWLQFCRRTLLCQRVALPGGDQVVWCAVASCNWWRVRSYVPEQRHFFGRTCTACARTAWFCDWWVSACTKTKRITCECE